MNCENCGETVKDDETVENRCSYCENCGETVKDDETVENRCSYCAQVVVNELRSQLRALEACIGRVREIADENAPSCDLLQRIHETLDALAAPSASGDRAPAMGPPVDCKHARRSGTNDKPNEWRCIDCGHVEARHEVDEGRKSPGWMPPYHPSQCSSEPVVLCDECGDPCPPHEITWRAQRFCSLGCAESAIDEYECDTLKRSTPDRA